MAALKAKREENELGFGTKTSAQRARLINKIGRAHV